LKLTLSPLKWGERQISEIELLSKLLDEVSDLDAILLVSYGGIAPPKHGVRYRDQMMLRSGNWLEERRRRGGSYMACPIQSFLNGPIDRLRGFNLIRKILL